MVDCVQGLSMKLVVKAQFLSFDAHIHDITFFGIELHSGSMLGHLFFTIAANFNYRL